jgi:UDP-glucose 4-epimerase
MTKSIVTGGAGFIGSNLVDELVSKGHEVVVIDNESAKTNTRFYWNERASNYLLDICDYNKIFPLFEGVEHVYHLAAESRIPLSIENPVGCIRTNVLGTANILQCSRDAGVKRVMFSSTSSTYGRNAPPHTESQIADPLNPYSVSKYAAEKICRMYSELFGLETVVFRYFNIYGPREPRSGPYAPVIGIFLRQNEAGEPLTVVGDGLQRRDFTHVNDVVEANIMASSADIPKELFGTVFNVGSGVNHSVLEVAGMISPNVKFLPERLGEMKETLADITKIKVIGWTPKTNLESYLSDTLSGNKVGVASHRKIYALLSNLLAYFRKK